MFDRLFKIPFPFWLCIGLGIHWQIKDDPIQHIYFAAAFVIAAVHDCTKDKQL